jgi:hypothetical protein
VFDLVTYLSFATSPVTEPILGLSANTSYTFTVTGYDRTGDMFVSGPATLTTGALPGGLPSFTTSGTATQSGLTLIARISTSNPPDYLTVVNSAGEPVWYVEVPGNANLQVGFEQQQDGTFTLSVPPDAAHTLPVPGLSGTYVQVDVLGNTVATWNTYGSDGTGTVVDTAGETITLAATDAHDIVVESNGSALMYGLLGQTTDFSAQGGSATATGYYGVLANVASTTGEITWAWNSADLVSPTDVDPAATTVTGTYVDVTHANSVWVMQDGNYLVSFRNLSAVWKVNSSTGDVIWRLGGAGISAPASGGPTGDFTFVDDPLGGFSCQHSAWELSNGDIMVFDDGDGHSPRVSRGVEYQLDTSAMTATMVWNSTPSGALYTYVFGSSQRFSGNGDTLVAYGTKGVVEEWDPTGTTVEWTLTDASHGYGIYRAYQLGSLYYYQAP